MTFENIMLIEIVWTQRDFIWSLIINTLLYDSTYTHSLECTTS